MPKVKMSKIKIAKGKNIENKTVDRDCNRVLGVGGCECDWL